MKIRQSVFSFALRNGLAFLKVCSASSVLAICAIAGASSLGASPTLHEVLPFYSGPMGACPNGRALLVLPNLVFGTTYYGGNDNFGIVYQLTYANGTFTETVLYSFTGGSDGGNPTAGLYMDATGAIYGTASTSNGLPNGTVFRLAPNGDGTYKFSVLHSFGAFPDGANPNSNLIASASGNLYGTTVNGGAGGQGTVFALKPNGDGTYTESVIYSFLGATDGSQPYAGLTADSSGNLFGAAYVGGASNAGTVFELSPPAVGVSRNWTETTLYSFTGGLDGLNPLGGVSLVGDGSILGTTYLGGSTPEAGLIFKLTPLKAGGYAETVPVDFDGTNGANPSDTLISDGAGGFYGSTGGAQFGNGGSIFRLVPRPAHPTLFALFNIYTFSGGADGQAALPSISQATKGSVFGTTFYGGPGGAGSVFSLY